MIKRFASPSNKYQIPLTFSLFAISSGAWASGDVAADVSDVSTVREYVTLVGLFVAASLVMIMQAGFALLESGLSRAKNSVNVIIKNYGDLCFGTIGFALVGYGLLFGENVTGYFGADKFMLSGVSDAEYMTVFFQCMFAATAVTICSGAMAERTSITGYLIAAMVMISVIYPVFGSWVWNSGGWLAQRGFHDFAGATVVHSLGGWAALAAVIVLGPRFGRFSQDGQAHDIPGHSLNSAALGCFILWFGWFGFNVGSAIGTDISLSLVALNTQIGAASGAVGSIFMSVVLGKKIQATGIINGVLGGLVSITAGADIILPQYAILVGFLGGLCVPIFESIFLVFRLDDVVGAITVHGVCGVWGTIAVGLFYGEQVFQSQYIVPQLIGVGACFVYVFPVALLLFWILKKAGVLRASTRDEQRGLDYSEHSEVAYPEFQQSKMHGS